MKRFGRAKKGICVVLALLAAVGAAVWTMASTADITDLDDLGPYTHYNGILFDTVETYSADVEGALAIGGKAKLGTGWGQFDFGAAAYPNYIVMGSYDNLNNYPTVLLNDTPQVGTGSFNNVHAYGGPVVASERIKDSYQAGNRIHGETLYADADIVDEFFDSAYSETVRVGALFDSADTQAGTVKLSDVNTYWTSSMVSAYNGPDYDIYEADIDATGTDLGRIAVVTYDSGANADIFYLYFPKDILDEYDLVVLNFPDAKSASFSYNSIVLDGTTPFNTSSPGDANMEEYCPKIIWSFPQAEMVSITSCGIVGSVLAPNAEVKANGGSLNGMLVADSMKTENGFELHGFTMKNIYDLDKDLGGGVTGSVELTKVAEGTAELLAGAEFELYYANGTQYDNETYTTDTYGKLVIEDLPEGSYYLQEVTPPNGYDYDKDSSDKYEFTINADHTVIELEVENTLLTTELTVTKVEAGTTTG